MGIITHSWRIIGRFQSIIGKITENNMHIYTLCIHNIDIELISVYRIPWPLAMLLAPRKMSNQIARKKVCYNYTLSMQNKITQTQLLYRILYFFLLVLVGALLLAGMYVNIIIMCDNKL